MLIALIADLHGNRPATMALEEDLSKIHPNAIWCLGDLIGKGPANVFTYEWVMSHCSLILGGNWDYGIGRKHYPGDYFYWDSLGEERLNTLRNLPTEKTVQLSGRSVRLFHGRPLMRKLLGVKDDEAELSPFFQKEDGTRWDVLIYADTHRQAFRTLSPGLLINIGSVGNALGEPRGCYALLNVEEGDAPAAFEVRLRQFEYDREAAAREALDCGMPNGDLFASEVRDGRYCRGNTAAKAKGEF